MLADLLPPPILSRTTMPSMAFIPPDMRTYDGRGWEPERTYHTPRRDEGSVKSQSGRWVPPSERAVPDWYGKPGVPSTWAGGKGGHFSQSGRRASDFPHAGSWGEGYAHEGFTPEARPLHGKREAQPWEAPLPRRSSTPPTRTQGQYPNHPLMMEGRVHANGYVPDKNLHHRRGYMSPDRALVGEEEKAAREAANRARLRERSRSTPRSGGLGDAAYQARQRALAAAEKRRIYIPPKESGLVTNKTHGVVESRGADPWFVPTPPTMAMEAGY